MKNTLTNQQQQLLREIRKAVTSNPFSSQRVEADSKITGLPLTTEPEKMLKATIEVAESVGNDLIRALANNVHSFSGHNHGLVDGLFLFIVFHRYIHQFDEHIKKQITSGDTPVTFNYFAEITKDLAGFGYQPNEINRHISIFFQMRRAFYFINTTLTGSCSSMEKLRSRLWNNIFTHDIGLYVNLLWNKMEDFSTLLTGETGTGKGVAAAAIGRSGYIPFIPEKKCFKESFTRAFLAINLSQIPETLIESELFGHKRGSFTGATADHLGIFARASKHGSVFLDEIGELSPRIQVKLLQVLQERTFSAVGDTTIQNFSGRVIGATNRDLTTLRKQGKFRDDFYYRLCSDTITIPSLRKRVQENPEDLKILSSHLLGRITGTSRPKLLQKVLSALKNDLPKHYCWQGNVRELEQSIRQILLTSRYTTKSDHSSLPQHTDLLQKLDQGSLSMAELTSWYCEHLYNKYGTYQQVAQKTGLDRRTVKKYLDIPDDPGRS